MLKLLLFLAVLHTSLGDANIYPIYLGCDSAGGILPYHVINVQNCNGQAVNVSFNIKNNNGGTILGQTVVYPVGNSYSQPNNFASILVNANNGPYPYTITFTNVPPGLWKTATIPCYSADPARKDCNPYGYGLDNNHQILTLPNDCVSIVDSLWSDSSHGCSYTLPSPNYLQSADKKSTLMMWSDGPVVIYSPPGNIIWSSGGLNQGPGPFHLDMQSDSNLVTYDSNGLYHFHINWGGGVGYPYHLTLQNGGVAVVIGASGTQIWSSSP